VVRWGRRSFGNEDGRVLAALFLALPLSSCRSPPTAPPDASQRDTSARAPASHEANGSPLEVLSGPQPVADASPSNPDAPLSNWVNCVGILHVIPIRAYGVANAERIRDLNPSIDTSARIADLAPTDLGTLCDWEACIRTNGYGHICYVNDAVWEQCRVCDGGADCSGLPMSQGDCVARAADPGVAPCHVGILEECLLQRAIRLPSDPRVTETCYVSQQACAGLLPGDLSAQAAAARHETDQVTIEECERELAITATIPGNDASVASWSQKFSAWDGGLPEDVDATADGSR